MYDQSEASLMMLEMLATVALLEDVPQRALRRGQVGTVVEVLGDGMYEVDFSDDNGLTYALVPVASDRLLRLVHEDRVQL